MRKIYKILSYLIMGVLLIRTSNIIKYNNLTWVFGLFGYIFILYPFYLFFRMLFTQIKFDAIRYRKIKKFYKQRGILYGNVYVGDQPLKNIKCIVKNLDGTLHKSSHKWVGVTDKNGFYEVRFLPAGEFCCEFTYITLDGNKVVKTSNFKINHQSQTLLNIEIKID